MRNTVLLYAGYLHFYFHLLTIPIIIKWKVLYMPNRGKFHSYEYGKLHDFNMELFEDAVY